MNKNRVFCLVGFLLIVTSCSSHHSSGNSYTFKAKGNPVPAFSADSAYQYVKKQVDFGPRTVNSRSHREDKAFLLQKLREYAGDDYVFAQNFQLKGYHDVTLNLSNIIAAFNPSASDRIMLCTHWDTRPYSDQDPDTSYRNKPIPGADDGGSGVGVLLELASLFKKNPPPIGVDLIFFDGEDYGKDDDLGKYFLGSRYWAKNQPVKGYRPRFGILLDMVGGVNAHFPEEGMSYQTAPDLVNEIWKVAHQMDYSKTFPENVTNGISDDHVVMNQYLPFPTIDIVNHTQVTKNKIEFPPYWHTHRDNMKIIDKHTLKKVGSLLNELIYDRL